jgi:hypothetical protein
MWTAGEQPRRDAVRAFIGSGLALLGLGQAVSSSRAANRPRKLKLQPSEGAVFNVDAGGNNGDSARCAAGSAVVSGVYTMTNPKCAPVIVGFDFVEAGGTSGWQLTVQCPPGESSANNTVQALCLVGAKIG